jgi:copper chaperone
MTEKTIRVPEIHCDHCKMSLEGAVGAVPGVETVRVDIPARTVHVRFDDASIGEEQIEAAIEAQGYEVQR